MTQKVLGDFEVQTDLLISASQPDQEKANKEKREKNCRTADFGVLADHMVKVKESESVDKYPDFTRELKKTNGA